MPTAEEWKERGNQNYGLVARSKSGRAAQVEKVDHVTAAQMLAGLGEIEAVGPSLGSFSVSSSMLFCLLEEFAAELSRREGKLDSDPHLWMPMTLQPADYVRLMGQKGVAASAAEAHHRRIAAMMDRFNAVPAHAALGTFGPVDVGQNICWWDYGLLKLYQKNVLLMAERTPEAALMRSFFGAGDALVSGDSTVARTSVDAASLLTSCQLGGGERAASSSSSVKASVLCNVRCRHIDAEGCILVNVTAERIVARPGSIVYNVVDDSKGGLDLAASQVMAGVFSDDGGQLVMRSTTAVDGGKAWEQRIEGNPKSFEEVYNMNASADPIRLEAQIHARHEARWAEIEGRNAKPSSRPLISSWTGALGLIAAVGVALSVVLIRRGSSTGPSLR
jgi:hypothetical protein